MARARWTKPGAGAGLVNAGNAAHSASACARKRRIQNWPLIERYKRCGKPGCKCADGPGHGPKYYLSVSFPGRRPQMDYVPQADYADVTQRLANYHRVREIIEEICEINRELLRRREAL